VAAVVRRPDRDRRTGRVNVDGGRTVCVGWVGSGRVGLR